MTGEGTRLNFGAETAGGKRPHATDIEILELSEEMHMSIWTVLFIILLIAWLCGFTVFHVAGGLIHLLLIFAVISLILHFVLGRRAV